MAWIWITYLAVLGVSLMFGLIMYTMSRNVHKEDERWGARLSLGAFIWPLVLPYFLYLGFKELWKSAGLSKPKPNSSQKETDY